MRSRCGVRPARRRPPRAHRANPPVRARSTPTCAPMHRAHATFLSLCSLQKDTWSCSCSESPRRWAPLRTGESLWRALAARRIFVATCLYFRIGYAVTLRILCCSVFVTVVTPPSGAHTQTSSRVSARPPKGLPHLHSNQMIAPPLFDLTALPLVKGVPSRATAAYATLSVRGLGAVAFVASVLAFCFADSTRVQITTIETAPLPGSSCQGISKVVQVTDLTLDPVSPVYSLAVGGSGNEYAGLVYYIPGLVPYLNPSAPFCATYDSTAATPPVRTLSYNTLFPSYDACMEAARATPPKCIITNDGIIPFSSDPSQPASRTNGYVSIQCNFTKGIKLNTGPFTRVPLELQTVGGTSFNLPGKPANTVDYQITVYRTGASDTQYFAFARNDVTPSTKLCQGLRVSATENDPTPPLSMIWFRFSYELSTLSFFSDQSCSSPLGADIPFTASSSAKVMEMFQFIVEKDFVPTLPSFLGGVYPAGCKNYEGNFDGKKLNTLAPIVLIEAAVKAAFTPEFVCAPFLDAPPYLCNTLQRQSGLSIATQSFSLFTTVVALLLVIAPYVLAYLKPQPQSPPSTGTSAESESSCVTVEAATREGEDAPGSKPTVAAPPLTDNAGKLHPIYASP